MSIGKHNTRASLLKHYYENLEHYEALQERWAELSEDAQEIFNLYEDIIFASRLLIEGIYDEE